MKKWERNYPRKLSWYNLQMESLQKHIKALEIYLNTGDPDPFQEKQKFREKFPFPLIPKIKKTFHFPPISIINFLCYEDVLKKKKNDLKELKIEIKSFEKDQIRKLEKPKVSQEIIFLRDVINNLEKEIKILKEDSRYIFTLRYLYEVELYNLRETLIPNLKDIYIFYVLWDKKCSL